MKITVVGTGYVGLITGVGYASHGHDVTCIDIVQDKINTINSGSSPLYEEGLEDLLKEVLQKNVRTKSEPCWHFCRKHGKMAFVQRS